jgi:aarF domain-containing kinase
MQHFRRRIALAAPLRRLEIHTISRTPFQVPTRNRGPCDRFHFHRRLFSDTPRLGRGFAVCLAATVPLALQEDRAEERNDLVLESAVFVSVEDERQLPIYHKALEQQSALRRAVRSIQLLFLSYIYEPIATGIRFLQLIAIFAPVCVTIPAIFLGPRDPEADNERKGKLWWYGFLVKQMERAGPTFIKVSLTSL